MSVAEGQDDLPQRIAGVGPSLARAAMLTGATAVAFGAIRAGMLAGFRAAVGGISPAPRSCGPTITDHR